MMKPDIGGEAMSKHSPDLPGWLGTARRERSVEEPGRPGRVGKVNDRNPAINAVEKSDMPIVCAEQRVVQEG